MPPAHRPSTQNTRTREAANQVPKPYRSRYHNDSSAQEQARLHMPLMMRCASSRRYTPSYTKPSSSCSQLGVDRKIAPEQAHNTKKDSYLEDSSISFNGSTSVPWSNPSYWRATMRVTQSQFGFGCRTSTSTWYVVWISIFRRIQVSLTFCGFGWQRTTRKLQAISSRGQFPT
jgi:hypothetical protein